MKNSSKKSEKSQATIKIFNKAESLRKKCQYKESLSFFRKALKRYATLNDSAGLFRCHAAIGDVYRMIGNFSLAADNYLAAINVSNSEDYDVKRADAEVGLGLSMRALGNWKDALFHINKSKKYYIKKNDTEGLAFTLWAEAGTYRIKGDIKKAIETFLESRKLFESLKDKHGTGYCMCGLGGASRIAGKFSDSLKYYKAANKIFTELKDKFGIAYSYCGIGNAYRMLLDFKKAFEFFRKASKIYEKIGDIVSYSYTLWGIGTSHKMIGNYKEADEFFNKAISNFKKTKDPRGLIYCKLARGELSLLKGNKLLAEKYIEEAFNDTIKYKFAIEKCYANTLKSILKKSGLNLSCYKNLGIELNLREIPFNIP
jgi:tetratricopeptide (TPR) repeat protein